MRGHTILFTAVCWMLFGFTSPASVLYVDVNSPNPVPPFAGWSTAAADIQSAVDASSDGDLILVTNGLYNTGGRVVYGTLTNRVVINKAVTVQSVNGPAATVIQGYQVPQGSTAYSNDVRCVYMTNDAVLSGFTITGGAALSAFGGGTTSFARSQLSGGGVFCESTNPVLTNCILNNNLCVSSFSSAGGGAVYQGTLNNCILSNNLVSTNIFSYGVPGGAAFQSVLNNCLIVSNSASFGGGAAGSTLNRCSVIGNIAPYYGSTSWGGGTYMCTANYCLIAGNVSTTAGGGDCQGILNFCILSNNVCYSGVGGNGSGGGSYQQPPNGSYNPTLNNCLVISNIAYGNGGGVYMAGNSGVWPILTNCTIVGNMATNQGGGAYGGILHNCILSNNVALISGGGANQSALYNCSVISNQASYGGGVNGGMTINGCLISNNRANSGAGVYGNALTNCILINNVASAAGGGTYYGSLINCLLIGNSSNLGGGAYQANLNNCIIYYNAVGASSNYYGGTLKNCCTIPLPATGANNITNEPLFLNLAGGDYHLQSNSPCINAGNNAYIKVTNDFDGNPRIVGGTVDIGAYEFQTPAAIISYAWLQQYGLPTDGTADYADSDGTGMNNWQKWIAGLNPTNAASVLKMSSLSNSVTGMKVTWQSVNTRTYYLQSSTNLPVFTSVKSNIVGQAGSTSYTDTTATNGGPYFYRVGVQ